MMVRRNRASMEVICTPAISIFAADPEALHGHALLVRLPYCSLYVNLLTGRRDTV